MSHWKEEIKNHSIFGRISDIENKIAEPDISETTYRIKVIMHYIKNVIEHSKAEFLIKSVLNEADNYLYSVFGDIDNYIHNRNRSNFSTNTNNNLDAALRIIGTLPSTKKINFSKQISDATASYLESVHKAYNNIDKKFQEGDEQIKRLNSQSQELNQKITQQSEAINNEKARIDKIISDFQNTILEVRNNVETQSNEQRDNIQVSFDELEDNIKQADQERYDKIKSIFDVLSQDLKSKAEKTVQDIQSKKDEATKLLGLASNIVLAGSYKQSASEEKSEADKLRKYALIAFGLASIIGIIFLIASFFHNPTVPALISRLSVILLVLGIGLYCAHESSQHRTEERNNRRMELELTSIDPYLENISDDKRDEVKVKIADRFFANPEINNKKTSKYYPFIIKKLLNIVDDAVKNTDKSK